MAYIGQSLTEGTRRVYTYVATASQTTFNAVYGVGAVDVYQNGVLLSPADYTASDGTTVVLGTGAALNDEITIVCHNTFSVADTYSKADVYTQTQADAKFADATTVYTQAQADAKFVDVAGDTMTGDLSFGDNNKAIFGAGSDLQIFHDGVHTYIDETNPTGYLFIRGANTQLLSPSNDIFLECNNDGSVDLYYDNSKKLATTATGVDITGTVSATSFSGSGASLTGLPAPTTAQVLSATAGASAGDVGTYGFFRDSGSVIGAGGTIAGSSLSYASQRANVSLSSGTPSGTWRVMGYFSGNVWNGATYVESVTVCLRIS